MAQNNLINLKMIDASTLTQNGQIVLTPAKDRNGIYEYTGRTINGEEGVFLDTVDSKITASVRQGVPADFLGNKQRIKRRTTLKCALPISVPGASGTTVDYINVDVVLSAPVEATDGQIATALGMPLNACYDGSNSPLKDLVVYGREPY